MPSSFVWGDPSPLAQGLTLLPLCPRLPVKTRKGDLPLSKGHGLLREM